MKKLQEIEDAYASGKSAKEIGALGGVQVQSPEKPATPESAADGSPTRSTPYMKKKDPVRNRISPFTDKILGSFGLIRNAVRACFLASVNFCVAK